MIIFGVGLSWQWELLLAEFIDEDCGRWVAHIGPFVFTLDLAR